MKIMKALFVLTTVLAAVSSIRAQEAVVDEAATASSGETVDEWTLDLDGDDVAESAGSDADAEPVAPVQSGPFVDLLGPTLLSLEMVDETHAQLAPHYTTDALHGKTVVGLYFSADW
jgi:hypothetical protein